MACPALHSGERFLATALAHVDCQAQAIGSYGYGALADPGSGVSAALVSLLTLFIALFGIRLLLGHAVEGRDVVMDVLKIGIVLTIAMSWPAWRIVGYDLFINGPAEIARAIGFASGLPGAAGDFSDRLQRVDAGLAALNATGSGRLGVAQGDWFQLGLARSAYLISTLAPLALVKLMTGILLALAPLMAGLMLFGVTRSIFIGWARGLVMVFLASVSLTVVLCAQLALLEPWLQDALSRRQGQQQILDAPVEIVVLALAFAIIAIGVLLICARVAFHPDVWGGVLAINKSDDLPPLSQSRRDAMAVVPSSEGPERAYSIAAAVGESLRREERLSSVSRVTGIQSSMEVPSPVRQNSLREPADVLGTSYRRGARRVSSASQRRDQRS